MRTETTIIFTKQDIINALIEKYNKEKGTNHAMTPKDYFSLPSEIAFKITHWDKNNPIH